MLHVPEEHVTEVITGHTAVQLNRNLVRPVHADHPA
jgi:hypothetical protein